MSSDELSGGLGISIFEDTQAYAGGAKEQEQHMHLSEEEENNSVIFSWFQPLVMWHSPDNNLR